MAVGKPTSMISVGANYQLFSYGFLNKGCYRHRSKHCEIQSITYNSKTGELIIVDSRGINTWAKNFVTDYAKRVLNFSSYEYNAVRSLLYCAKYNIYFALSKGYRLQVFNLNFNETFSVTNDSAAAHYICVHEESGDLIAVGQGCIRIWRYGEILHHASPCLSTFGLHLRLEIETPPTVHISKVEIDNVFNRMYCLVENGIWCYDMDGRFAFKTQLATSSHVTACVFTPLSHLLVVGTIDGNIHAVTTAGVAVHTFRLYSKIVTGLLVHPSESQLILTSSMDGSIRMISLDTMSEVYNLPAISEGITLMQLRSKSHLLCASSKAIEVFDLNYLCGLWAQLPYKCQSLQVAKSGNRSTKVLVMGEDFNVKLYSKKTRKTLTTVFPPPPVSPKNAVLSSAYDPAGGLLYLLIGCYDIWVYTTRTDPACRVVAWKTADLCLPDSHHMSKLNELLGCNEGFPYHHKGKQNEDKCNCLCVLDFQGIKETGVCNKPLINGIRPLACGVENGTVMVVYSHKDKTENKSFKISTGAIFQMKVNYQSRILIAITQGKDCYYVQTVNALNFQVIKTLELESLALSCFAFSNETLGLGFDNGVLCIIPASCRDLSDKLAGKQDHKGCVLSIDFDKNADIICTAGSDGYVKLWDQEKMLLCDFHLDATLTTACFLNDSRDIIIGFKNHLYMISSQLLDNHAILRDFDVIECSCESDNDSIVYESPYLKHDSQRLYIPEDTTMETYLVPYDYLNLDKSFLKDSGANLVIDPYEESAVSRKESLASTSELSFASTGIYQSLEGSVAGDDLETDLPFFGISPTPSFHSVASEVIAHEESNDTEIEENEENPSISEKPKQAMTEKLEKVEQREAIEFSHRKSKAMKIDSSKIQKKKKTKKKAKTKAEHVKETVKEPVQQDVKKVRSREKRTAVRQKRERPAPSIKDPPETIQTSENETAEELRAYSPLPTDEDIDSEEISLGREVTSTYITLNKVSISAINSKEEARLVDGTEDKFSAAEEDEQHDQDGVEGSHKDSMSHVDEKILVSESKDVGMSEAVEKAISVDMTSVMLAGEMAVARPFASSSQEESEESMASESDTSLGDETSSQAGLDSMVLDQDEASAGLPSTPAARTVRFKHSPRFHRKLLVKKERVVPVSKLHETTQKDSPVNQAPLSIFSLAKRRQDSGTPSKASDRVNRYRTKTPELKSRTKAEALEESKTRKRTKAVRVEEEPSSFVLSNQKIKRRERTSVASMSATSLPDYNQVDTNEEKVDLMKFCVNAMKKTPYTGRRNKVVETQTASRQSERPGPIHEENILDDAEAGYGQRDSFSLHSVTSDSAYSDRCRGYVATPSVRIFQRPSTPASQFSGSVDDDKCKVDYDYFRQKYSHGPHYPEQSIEHQSEHVRSTYEQGVAGMPSGWHYHSHIRGKGEHRKVFTTAIKDNDDTFKRIQSAGLRDELKRRKLLASQNSARQASAMERRSEYKVQARRCISAGPTLVRHDPSLNSQDEKVEMVYEYTSPTPLPCSTPSRTSRSPAFSNRSIEAKLAGQPFRYGRKFDVDEADEKVMIAFARMLISKSDKPVILPKRQTAPSIPAKCRDFILVDESKDKEKQKLTRMERQILIQRFQGFMDAERTPFSPLATR